MSFKGGSNGEVCNGNGFNLGMPELELDMDTCIFGHGTSSHGGSVSAVAAAVDENRNTTSGSNSTAQWVTFEFDGCPL